MRSPDGIKLEIVWDFCDLLQSVTAAVFLMSNACTALVSLQIVDNDDLHL